MFKTYDGMILSFDFQLNFHHEITEDMNVCKTNATTGAIYYYVPAEKNKYAFIFEIKKDESELKTLEFQV